MIVRIIETEFNIAGHKMSDYELTLSEYTKRIAKHISSCDRTITYTSNSVVFVKTPFAMYSYHQIVR